MLFTDLPAYDLPEILEFPDANIRVQLACIRKL